MTVREELPVFLTADETADLLRTTRRAVYAMAERGQLPGVTRIGRRLLVRREVRRLRRSLLIRTPFGGRAATRAWVTGLCQVRRPSHTPAE